MRRSWKTYAVLCVTGALAVSQMAGCSEAATEETAAQGQMEISEEKEREVLSAADSVTAKLGEGNEKTVLYEAEDKDASWNADEATGIILEESGIRAEGAGVQIDGSTALIKAGGTYVVSGTLADGQIRIEAEAGEVVHLVLNGAELGSQERAPIYSLGGCKVILTLEEGTHNVIRDGGTLLADGERTPEAAVHTEGDLSINGTGSLQVYGSAENGVFSRNILKLVSGNVCVEAGKHGIKGADGVQICGGELEIVSGKDGIKASSEEDGLGYIWIDGGSITIAAQDDGIQAEQALVINGGEIVVKESQEALAGKSVDILGGTVTGYAEDDGINSAASVETEEEKQMDQEGVYTRIAGGEIRINAMADGIDSNGDFYMEGGSLYVSGPVSSGDGILDYNGTARISGGTIFAAGSAGMMQTFSEDSEQNYLVVYYEEPQAAQTQIQLLEASGTLLGSFTPEKEFEAVIISCPGLETGSEVQVKTGEETLNAKLEEIETILGTFAGKKGFRGGPKGEPFDAGERPEPPEGMERPSGERPELPEGMKRPSGERPEPLEGMERPSGEHPEPENGKRGEQKMGATEENPD